MSREIEEFRATLQAWRSLSEVEQVAHFTASASATRKARDGRIRASLLCTSLVQGGAEVQQLTIARRVDPNLVEWMGCCLVSGPSDQEMVAQNSALMPVTFGPASARHLGAACDVVIGWGIEDYDRLLGTPRPKVAAVMHVPGEANWKVARGVDRWVAVSELALDAIPPEHPPASVIWNAVDPGRLAIRRSRSELRRLWGVPEDKLVAGYLGRLSSEKDPLAMVRLAGSLPEPWRVVVVGDGPERLDLVRPSNLILAGADPAVGDVLNAFDVLVVPSLYESFGLTLAEGLVAGKPVVSTEVGLAKLCPGITTSIPINADGPTLANAVVRARLARKSRAVRDLIPRLLPERFGREWTELITRMAPKVMTPIGVPSFAAARLMGGRS